MAIAATAAQSSLSIELLGGPFDGDRVDLLEGQAAPPALWLGYPGGPTYRYTLQFAPIVHYRVNDHRLSAL